jgi:branched-chain amino acid transport system substrate-binding protein
VGVICSCSGALGADDAPAAKVYTAWANTVNASGGINGHMVQLINEDDAANPGNSVADIHTLLSDGVVAIMDFSLLDEAWASTVEAAKVPIVGGNVNEIPFYTNSDFYPEGETEDAVAYSLVATGKTAGGTKMGYFYCAEAPICSETATLISKPGQQLGTPVVYKAEIAATAPNYTAQCVAAQQLKANTLLNGDVDPVFERVAENCTTQGFHPIYISSGASYSNSMDSTPGIKDNSWYEANDLPFFANNPAVNQMNAAVNKYFPGLESSEYWSGGASVEPWASGILLEDAVKAGGIGPSTTPTAAAIVEGLESLKGDTLDGTAPPLTFTAGQPHPVDCWFTFQVKNGIPAMTNNSQPTCESGSSS